MTPDPEEHDEHIPRSWYEEWLKTLDDDIDAALDTLLDPIGVAITDSRIRIANFRTRYGDNAPELAAELEDLLGIAFLASQTYITTVVSRLLKLHELVRRGSKTELTTTSSGPKRDMIRDMMRHGFPPTQKTPYSPIEVMNAFANYYKHRDEWDADWTSLEERQQETATIIMSASAFQSSTENLRIGARYLGNSVFSNTKAFVGIFKSWRKRLIGDYEAEVHRLRSDP